jgi:hypothetical protein
MFFGDSFAPADLTVREGHQSHCSQKRGAFRRWATRAPGPRVRVRQSFSKVARVARGRALRRPATLAKFALLPNSLRVMTEPSSSLTAGRAPEFILVPSCLVSRFRGRCNRRCFRHRSCRGRSVRASRRALVHLLGVIWGVINGTQVFAPGMIARRRPGLIINTGSKQGITTPPGDPAYNVSKAGVKAFTEALQHELRNMKDCRINAHLLIPGFVFTALTAKGRAEKPAAAWTPEQTVDFTHRRQPGRRGDAAGSRGS